MNTSKGAGHSRGKKRMDDTVSPLLEGLRGRDCQGISLDNPLDTAMMDALYHTGRGLSFYLSFWRFGVYHTNIWYITDRLV